MSATVVEDVESVEVRTEKARALLAWFSQFSPGYRCGEENAHLRWLKAQKSLSGAGGQVHQLLVPGLAASAPDVASLRRSLS